MKKIVLIFSVLTFMLSTASCGVKTSASGDVPPGQMKKVTGKKSAKNYAPGQKKKKN